MKTNDKFDLDRDKLSCDEIEKILRQAQAERDAALGRAIRSLFRVISRAMRQLNRAVRQATRLRNLAMLDDRQLARLGLSRTDLPAHVYNWQPTSSAPVVQVVAPNDPEPPPSRPDRIAA